MGISGRTSKISSVVAVLCIFVYIVAIAFGAVRIIENIGERRSLAEREFSDLTDRASSSAVFLGFMSEAFQETIKDFISSSETLMGVIITGSDGEYAFERYPGSGIVWAGDSPRFKTGAAFFGEPFLLYLRIEGQRNVTIQAIYSPIQTELVLQVLRNTLLAVLAALAIALVTLLVELTTKKKAGYYRSGEDNDSAQKLHKKVSVDIIRRPDFGATTSMELPSGEFSVQAEHDEHISISGEEEPEIPIEEPAENENNNPVPDVEIPDEVPDETPQGLFTPRGNIGWESYTHDRLNSELHRCASFEQDLVFLVMEFRNIEKISNGLYRQFADEAVSFFAMRDLIFEKGEKGLSVIIPSVDLEQGIAKSEEFHSKIITELPEFFRKTNTDPGTELCIGLSSRSGRLIEAERLMLEAARALEKALGDPVSPIMAFKSDPEKYREFIKGRI